MPRASRRSTTRRATSRSSLPDQSDAIASATRATLLRSRAKDAHHASTSLVLMSEGRNPGNSQGAWPGSSETPSRAAAQIMTRVASVSHREKAPQPQKRQLEAKPSWLIMTPRVGR